MVSKKIKVRNTLHSDVKIKEGNAGVYAQKGIVKPGKTFELKLDVNATYREYVLITLPDNTELPVFSSDDLGDIAKEIVVMEEIGSNPPKYYWEGDPDGESCRRDQDGSRAESSSPGLYRRFMKALGFRS